jgi:hypothetical protein
MSNNIRPFTRTVGVRADALHRLDTADRGHLLGSEPEVEHRQVRLDPRRGDGLASNRLSDA